MAKGKTFMCIHTKEIYPLKSVQEKITVAFNKRNYPVPNFSHGRVSDVRKKLGIEPAGKIGRAYSYRGSDVILIIEKMLEDESKKKGEPKQRTKTSPSTKPMAKPSQISIDDISRNTKIDQLIEMLWDGIGILESMKEK